LEPLAGWVAGFAASAADAVNAAAATASTSTFNFMSRDLLSGVKV
jgi:hypothetical protein